MAESERGSSVGNVAFGGLRATVALLAVLTLLGATERSALGQDCSFNDQCQTAMCTNSGNCNVTNLPDGTGCNDGNPCTTVDECVSGTCTGMNQAPTNTACDDGNPCVVNKKCNASGKCVGTALADDTQCSYPGLACPGKCTTLVGNTFCQLCKGADPCTMGTCNFSTGQCQTSNFCNADCQTGDCVVESFPPFGDVPVCMNQQDQPDNTPCDDGNSCTSNDKCQSGQCVGAGFSGPPLTPTPFYTPPTMGGNPTSTPTPTRTATVAPPTATRTATVPAPTATRTATLPPPTATATLPPPTATATILPPTATATTALPSATATTGPEATATPTGGATPGAGCVGDCDTNHAVSASELVQGINIVLGTEPLANCTAFDPDHTGKVTVVQVAQGVDAALGGCGGAAGAH